MRGSSGVKLVHVGVFLGGAVVGAALLALFGPAAPNEGAGDGGHEPGPAAQHDQPRELEAAPEEPGERAQAVTAAAPEAAETTAEADDELPAWLTELQVDALPLRKQPPSFEDLDAEERWYRHELRWAQDEKKRLVRFASRAREATAPTEVQQRTVQQAAAALARVRDIEHRLDRIEAERKAAAAPPAPQ